ncbi:oxidoreductase-like protein [Pseudolysobacter antarcticus]|uniref:Oxidoreductase-like protein n=1 Tax=Pseudolysobacter antarcticus TaxID=2511995 RepID=A0A411HK37_9GAMM|nr:oxidoreductase-like domain-containing protein [Pseudolysobacter antarcticus]QBB70841.1 oxidoreductase-like protein [Pseudolysobacter antarcticus]
MNLANDTPPLPPIEPDPGDCCGEGCTNCVFDIYEAAMARYLIALAAWKRDRES